MPKAKNEHLLKIDVLRGIAILSVFVYHSQLCFFPFYEVYEYKNGILHYKSYKELFLNIMPSSFGWSGVQLFLLISGFLIHFGYLKNGLKFHTSSFFFRRFWRIIPPYIIILLFFCIYHDFDYYFKQKLGIYDLLSHVFLLHNLSDTTFFSINPSFWSLALEAQLYIIYPIFLFIRTKMGINKTILIVLMISITTIVLGCIFNNFNTQYVYKMSLLNSWGIWCLGAYLAENYFTNGSNMPRPRIIHLIFLFVFLIVSKLFQLSNYFIDYTAAIFWFLTIYWYLNRPSKPETKITKFFVILGMCSYSFYLIHQPLLGTLLNNFKLTSSVSLRFINILPVFLFLFLLSYIIYRILEINSIKLGVQMRERKN